MVISIIIFSTFFIALPSLTSPTVSIFFLINCSSLAFPTLISIISPPPPWSTPIFFTIYIIIPRTLVPSCPFPSPKSSFLSWTFPSLPLIKLLTPHWSSPTLLCLPSTHTYSTSFLGYIFPIFLFFIIWFCSSTSSSDR